MTSSEQRAFWVQVYMLHLGRSILAKEALWLADDALKALKERLKGFQT